MDLGAFATELLTDVGNLLTIAGRTVPDRQYVTAGEVVDDCEQLAVSYIRHYGTNGNAAAEVVAPITCDIVLAAEFEIRLTKCYPAQSLPEADEINTAGIRAVLDSQALELSIYSLGSREWALRPLVVAGPTGGFIASSIVIGVLDI